jgi:pimeloyl-ACP methyl ester carboxylesterase
MDEIEGLVLISPPVRDFRFGERTSTRRSAHGMNLPRYVRAAFRPEVLRGLTDAGLRRRYFVFAKRKVAIAWRRARGVKATAQTRTSDESATFLEPLRGAFRRGVPTLLLYGEHEDYYEEFQRHLASLGPLFEDPSSSCVRLATLPGVVHGFTDLETQGSALDLVLSWMEGVRAAEPDARPSLGTAARGERVGGGSPS